MAINAILENLSQDSEIFKGFTAKYVGENLAIFESGLGNFW